MKKMSKLNFSKFSGAFTLIELMVVIAIIAILTAILTANFSAAKSRSRDGQRISDTAQIQLALAGYFNQCNSYPAPDTGNVIGLSGSTMLTQPNSSCPGITLGSFISKIPTPPAGASQTNYTYITGTTNGVANTDYLLEATLENSSNVSSESIAQAQVPADISGATCDTTTHYCLGPK
jgi:prepilin-type N-terminal cleavage/methylation domain-containing protein